jgi:hypothetical protein
MSGATACRDDGTPRTPHEPASSGSPATAASPGDSAPSAPAAPGATAPAAGSAPAAGAAGPVECTLANLSVTTGKPGVASGHHRALLVFTDTGATSCTMQGYPGVALLDAGSAQVAQARRTAQGYSGGLPYGQSPPLVSLRPGQSASAIVEALATEPDGVTACKPWSGLLVTVPDDTRSTQLLWNAGGCADPQVHPVVPGTEGSLS